MLTLVLLAFAAYSAAQDECVALSETGLTSLVDKFGFDEAINGNLPPFCCGDGKVQLGKIDIGAALGAEAEFGTPATYIKDETNTNLDCIISSAGLKAIAAKALGEEADLTVVKINCNTDDNREFLKFDAKTFASSCSPGGQPVPQPTTKEGETTKAKTDAEPSEPSPSPSPKEDECSDLKALLDNPLRFLFGFTACVDGVGKFTVNKLDLSQVRGAVDGSPLDVSGSIQLKGGKKISAQCTIGEKTTALLVPFAKDFDVKALDIDALTANLDISCFGADGQHLITVDGTDIKGLSPSDLKELLKVAGVDVKVHRQVYKLVTDNDLRVGGYELKDGVLTTPSGQSINVGDAVEFYGGIVVSKKQGKIDSLVTKTHGRVYFKDGKVVFVRENGDEKVIGQDCNGEVSRVGAFVKVKCEGVQIKFAPGGLQTRDNAIVDTDGKPRERTGAFRFSDDCQKDPACVVDAYERAQKKAESLGCKLALNPKDDQRYVISCPDKPQSAGAQVSADIVADVNENQPANLQAETVDVEEPMAAVGVPGGETKKESSGVERVVLAGAALFSLVVAMI